jgi:sRNA-binding protein
VLDVSPVGLRPPSVTPSTRNRKGPTRQQSTQLRGNLCRQPGPALIAFPPRSEDVRPLALGVVPIVAAETGWSWPYAKGVLRRWKEAPAYCRAVLSCPNRINLDGSEAGPVDDVARDHARSRLEKIRKGREERKLREAQRAAEAALRFPSIEAAPPAAEPQPAEPSPPPGPSAEVERHETPKQMKMRLAAEAKAAKHAQKRAIRAGAP